MTSGGLPWRPGGSGNNAVPGSAGVSERPCPMPVPHAGREPAKLPAGIALIARVGRTHSNLAGAKSIRNKEEPGLF